MGRRPIPKEHHAVQDRVGQTPRKNTLLHEVYKHIPTKFTRTNQLYFNHMAGAVYYIGIKYFKDTLQRLRRRGFIESRRAVGGNRNEFEHRKLTR